VYSRAGVDPSSVSFVELHGTGTLIGDMQETNSVSEVFCKDRSGPLLIGSVKSNMGHSEISSGLSSLAKVVIAMHDHALPPNLHFKQPNPDIPGLFDGRLKVVSHNFTSCLIRRRTFGLTVLVMVALCNRADHNIFRLFLLSSSSFFFFFFSSPNLSGRRLDVYHTLAHGVALVRI